MHFPIVFATWPSSGIETPCHGGWVKILGGGKQERVRGWQHREEGGLGVGLEKWRGPREPRGSLWRGVVNGKEARPFPAFLEPLFLLEPQMKGLGHC